MKIAIRRSAKAAFVPDAGSSFEDGPGMGTATAVLDAPEESYASEPERVVSWPGGGAAPAGALQRGFGPDAPIEGHDEEFGAVSMPEEEAYVPRRGASGAGWRRMLGSLGGRIVLGCGVFVVVGAVGAAVVGGRYLLLHDERFLLAGSSEIQVVGAEHLTRAQVLQVFGADLERNVFRMSLAERRADLERLPWVEHATVMRLLPNRIRVQITERTPVAFVRQGTEIGLVDAGGVLLDMPPESAGDPKYSFPVLTGLAAGDPLPVRAARMEVYKRFMQELDGSGERLSNQLSEVDVSNPEDVKALVATGGTDVLVHFGDEDFLARYKEFQQHLGEWRSQYPKLASADMRYEGQIVLEMQQGAGVPVNEAGSGDGPAAVAATTADSSAALRNDNQKGNGNGNGNSKSNSDDKRRSPAGMTNKDAAATTTATAAATVTPTTGAKAPAPTTSAKAAVKPTAKGKVVKKAAAKKPVAVKSVKTSAGVTE